MRHHGVPDARHRRQRGLLGLHRATAPSRSPPTCGSPTARRSAPAAGPAARAPPRATARPTRCSSTTATGSRSPATTCSPGLLEHRDLPGRGARRARARARVSSTWHSLRRTARMPLERLLTGHGDPVPAHARPRAPALRRPRAPLRADRRRARAAGPRPRTRSRTRLWPSRTVREQSLLVVWEVLGHLDLLLDADAVREAVTDDVAHFELSRRRVAPRAGARARDRTHEPEAHGGGRRARAS